MGGKGGIAIDYVLDQARKHGWKEPLPEGGKIIMLPGSGGVSFLDTAREIFSLAGGQLQLFNRGGSVFRVAP